MIAGIVDEETYERGSVPVLRMTYLRMRSFLMVMCLSALPSALTGQGATVSPGDTTGFVVQALRFAADSVLRDQRIALDSVVASDQDRKEAAHPASRWSVARGAHQRIQSHASLSQTVAACRRAANQCEFPGFDVVLQVGVPRGLGEEIAVPIVYSSVGEDRGAPDPIRGGVRTIRRAYLYVGLVIFTRDTAGRWRATRYMATEFG
jgi:hypothetical protein